MELLTDADEVRCGVKKQKDGPAVYGHFEFTLTRPSIIILANSAKDEAEQGHPRWPS
jgi:hypothetical protein